MQWLKYIDYNIYPLNFFLFILGIWIFCFCLTLSLFKDSIEYSKQPTKWDALLLFIFCSFGPLSFVIYLIMTSDDSPKKPNDGVSL